jgi:hypothetical protein
VSRLSLSGVSNDACNRVACFAESSELGTVASETGFPFVWSCWMFLTPLLGQGCRTLSGQILRLSPLTEGQVQTISTFEHLTTAQTLTIQQAAFSSPAFLLMDKQGANTNILQSQIPQRPPSGSAGMEKTCSTGGCSGCFRVPIEE